MKFSNFTKSSSSESLKQINFEKRFQTGEHRSAFTMKNEKKQDVDLLKY